MSEPHSHPTFLTALAEIEALGLRASHHPTPGATPYAIIGGRSNARWWLLPLKNRHVTRSGLALFQPILPSARLMKQAAVTLTQVGLHRLWAKPKLFISGNPEIGCYFGEGRLSYAYFTGTDCPHRKISIQIMDDRGNLKGFAKVTQNPAVAPLLGHEAATLNYLATLDLRTAEIPNVLYHGPLGNTTLLVTDTLKTPRSRTVTTLQPAHLAFLEELAKKTGSARPTLSPIAENSATRQIKQPSASTQHSHTNIAANLAQRYADIAAHMPPEWQMRLQRALDYLDKHNQDLLPSSLTHGDFTPWNTFYFDRRLYVFDWEYAESQYPASNDLIHFLLAAPAFKKRPPAEQIKHLKGQIKSVYKLSSDNLALSHLVLYLINLTFRYIKRNETNPRQLTNWMDEKTDGALLDALISSGAIK